MKDNKNSSSQKAQKQKPEKQDISSHKPNTQASSVGTQSGKGAVQTTEKKPYSHRTGDATNFGERSYRED